MKHKFRFEALGTIWWIEAQVDDVVFAAIEDIARQFQDDYSRFQSESILSQLNTAHTLKHPNEVMVELVQYGVQAYQRTNGLFNMTSGAVLASRGYGKLHSGRMAEDVPTVVRVTADGISIQGDYSLDFGGFGKGYLIDKLYRYLCTHTDGDILVNGGGDMKMRFTKIQQLPLMHPFKPDQYFAKVSLQDGAMASSSPLHRAWGEDNHLVASSADSYNGPIAQLTVVANTAVDADMYATALTVSDEPLQLADEWGVEVLVAYKNGKYTATPNFPLVR